MCGFVGFIDYSKSSSSKILKSMCEVILHRGPDAGDYYFEEEDNCQIGLGHRRLSMLDLHASANQPMFYKNFIIIYNGEIYNFVEIKKELESFGHEFSTKSDTEVILHAFEQWGRNAVDKFIGMFSFLVYDKIERKIISVRDRHGVKPLHIYQNDKIVMWASEIKSFLRHPLFQKEINFKLVKTFLQLGHIPTPHSIYENVRKQFPGTIEILDLIKKENQVEEYWNIEDYYEKPILDIPFHAAKEETKKLLKSACEYRIVSDVPVGVFLNGGYDSTLVSASLQSCRTEKIKNFTIGVDDEKLNEAKFSKEISRRLGTEHTEYNITENEMFNLIEDIPFYNDEPFGDSSAIPTMLVSEMARKEVTVALSYKKAYFGFSEQ